VTQLLKVTKSGLSSGIANLQPILKNTLYAKPAKYLLRKPTSCNPSHVTMKKRKGKLPGRFHARSHFNTDRLIAYTGVLVCPGSLAFPFSGPHIRNQYPRKVWRTRRACQNVGPRNCSLHAHRCADGTIPLVPLRAFDIPAS